MEVIVDNVQSVINASKGGASRLEICTALSEGGLTPSVGFLKVAKKLVEIPIYSLIRPRGGDEFIYSDEEIEIMKLDMQLLKKNGSDGFVFGFLNHRKDVDINLCKEFVNLAAPLPCTFNRAFDFTGNQFKALEDVIKSGFKRILTSGQETTAEKGIQRIKELIKAAKDRIIVIPACGINEFNVGNIISETKVTEFHGSAKRNINTTMLVSKGPFISSTSAIEHIQFVCISTDEDMVKRIVRIADRVLKGDEASMSSGLSK